MSYVSIGTIHAKVKGCLQVSLLTYRAFGAAGRGV